jgi:hypothetical protein
MSLRSRITGSDETETDTDQAAADPALTDEAGSGGTGVRPTFTPAPETDDAADPTTVPWPSSSADDVAAQPPTLVEPAGPVDPDDAETGYPESASAQSAADRPDYAGSDNSMAGYSEPGSTDDNVTGYGAAEHGATDYNAPAGQPVSVEPEQTARAYEASPADSAAETYPASGATAADTAVAPVEPVSEQPVAGQPVSEPVTPAPAGKHAAPVSGSALDGPLFTENPELRGQWQHIQAEFVDDPQHAVADAADLVQQAGQALVATLQQRQERMRSEWDRDQANRTGTATDNDVTTTGGADTEQLRQIMQRYRALFDQLSQPV